MYRVRLTRRAEKALEGVFRADRTLYARFLAAFDAIAHDPAGGKPLRGKLRGLFSYRMGNYRILYETYHDRLIVIILDLGHRKEIYE